MINPDNVDVKIPPPVAGDMREARARLKQIENWLKSRDIKYSIVYYPVWAHFPVAINMRKEDALMFKLTYEPNN